MDIFIFSSLITKHFSATGEQKTKIHPLHFEKVMENEQLQVTEQLLVEQKSFYKLWYIDMKSVRKRDVYFNLLYKRGVMHKV